MVREENGRFGKGNKSGGRPKLSEETRLARAMSHEQMCNTVVRIGDTPIEEIKEKLGDTKTPARERAIMAAYAKLDYNAMKYYEDRLWGRAQENIDLSINDLTVSIKNDEENERLRNELNLVIEGNGKIES